MLEYDYGIKTVQGNLTQREKRTLENTYTEVNKRKP